MANCTPWRWYIYIQIWRIYMFNIHMCLITVLWYLFDIMNRYGMIYLLTAVWLTPGGSSTVHIYKQTMHRTTQSTKTIYWTRHFTNVEECGPCPIFGSYYTLAFALQLRKKHGKTWVRVARKCLLARWKQNIRNRAYITIRIHKHNNRNT